MGALGLKLHLDIDMLQSDTHENLGSGSGNMFKTICLSHLFSVFFLCFLNQKIMLNFERTVSL